jgi:hypothetical protein
MFMAGLFRDIPYALRRLGRSPYFTATAISMLALGIGATSTALSWIEGTMLRPVPVARDTGRLVTVMRGTWNVSPAPPFSYPDYRDLRETNRTFSGILGYHHDWATLTGGDSPQRIYAAEVTGNYFDVLGIQPALGRLFRTDEEARLGGVPYVVLGYSLWKTKFGGDPGVLGKSIEIQHQPFTIIGVAPEGFIGCMPAIREDIWAPLAPSTTPGGNDWNVLHRENAWLNVMGRLRPGVSREAATQDLETIMRRLVAEYPAAHLGVKWLVYDVRPLRQTTQAANTFAMMESSFASVFALLALVLAASGIYGVLAYRTQLRTHEIGVRMALGAGRRDVLWLILRQGLQLAALGIALGLVLTVALTRFISAQLYGVSPADPLTLLLVTLLLAVVAAAASWLPALRAIRIDPLAAIHEP